MSTSEHKREAFYWRKAGDGFADLTRWAKDSFGTIRGLVVIALIVLCFIGGKRLIDNVLPKKEVPQIGSVTADNGARVDVKKIEHQKNSILGLF